MPLPKIVSDTYCGQSKPNQVDRPTVDFCSLTDTGSLESCLLFGCGKADIRCTPQLWRLRAHSGHLTTSLGDLRLFSSDNVGSADKQDSGTCPVNDCIDCRSNDAAHRLKTCLRGASKRFAHMCESGLFGTAKVRDISNRIVGRLHSRSFSASLGSLNMTLKVPPAFSSAI